MRSTTVDRPIRGSRILLAGVAYKPEVSDTRESLSLEIMRQLLKRGAEVRYCDPHVSEVLLDDLLHRSVEWSADEIGDADCVVLLTAHSAFADSGLWDAARLVVDTRNAVPGGPAVRLI